MLKGYRLAIAAVGVIAFLVIWAALTMPNRPSAKVHDPSKAAKEEYTYAGQYHPEYGISFFASSKKESESTADQSKDHAGSDGIKALNAIEADLIAQERMAHWTLWIGVFTAAGLAAIILTLAETREVTRVTREIGVAQTVAYPSIDRLEVGLGERQGDPYRLIINSIWKNAGNTPAFDFGGTYHLVVKIDGETVIDCVLKTNEETGLQRIDPGSLASLHSAPDNISLQPYVSGLCEGRASITVKIVGSYKTAFDKIEPINILFKSAKIFAHADQHSGRVIFNIKMARQSAE